jgi:hypothetical protein
VIRDLQESHVRNQNVKTTVTIKEFANMENAIAMKDLQVQVVI